MLLVQVVIKKDKGWLTSFATTSVFSTKYCLHCKPAHHTSLSESVKLRCSQSSFVGTQAKTYGRNSHEYRNRKSSIDCAVCILWRNVCTYLVHWLKRNFQFIGILDLYVKLLLQGGGKCRRKEWSDLLCCSPHCWVCRVMLQRICIRLHITQSRTIYQIKEQKFWGSWSWSVRNEICHRYYWLQIQALLFSSYKRRVPDTWAVMSFQTDK